MVTTRNHARIGRSTVEATVRISIPLKDTEAPGNLGRYGFDDDSERRAFPDAAAARRWCEQFTPAAGAVVDDAVIETGRWDASTYGDETYGLVEDAEHVVETEQYGSPDQSGNWTWEDPTSV